MTHEQIRTLVLTDIEKEKFIYRENSYRIKQYKHWEFSGWIDENGKKIKERVFSFILWKGNSWDNSTHLDLKESEVETVIERFKAIIVEKKAERKRRLTLERVLRSKYPRHLVWKFDNVTITVVESVCYTESGYFIDDQKRYCIYANENPYRYGSGTVPLDFEFTIQWVLENIASRVVARYNITPLSKERIKPVETVVMGTFSQNFLPYHFYIGYAVRIDNVDYNVSDIIRSSVRGHGFKTNKGEISVPLLKLGNLEIIGELTGMEAFAALKNKYKYME